MIRRRKNIPGFTFIEILLVVIIFGILIGVSLPKFRKTFNNLQLKSFTQELQSFMNYLRERSIVESKVFYLNIGQEEKACWMRVEGSQERLKTLAIPEGISISLKKEENESQAQLLFYPDGRVDNVKITLSNASGEKMSIITKGVFGGAKVVSEE